jgi:hypothetical protein
MKRLRGEHDDDPARLIAPEAARFRWKDFVKETPRESPQFDVAEIEFARIETLLFRRGAPWLVGWV